MDRRALPSIHGRKRHRPIVVVSCICCRVGAIRLPVLEEAVPVPPLSVKADAKLLQMRRTGRKAVVVLPVFGAEEASQEAVVVLPVSGAEKVQQKAVVGLDRAGPCEVSAYRRCDGSAVPAAAEM